MPGRAILNSFLKDVNSGEKKEFKCPWRCLESCKADNANYCISIALDNARKGILKHGFAFAGANAYKINQIISVKEIISQLKKEFITEVEANTLNLKQEYEKTLARFIEKKKEYHNRLRVLKKEYQQMVKKKHDYFLDEYNRIVKKIEELKKDYQDCFEQLKRTTMELKNLTQNGRAFPIRSEI